MKYPLSLSLLKKIIFIIVSLMEFGLLTGCASVANGTHEKIWVTTPPTTNADCTLKNTRGSWEVKQTPGTANVHRDNHPLDVRCNKVGYQTAHTSVGDQANGTTFGNIFLGGIVGAVVDQSNGAAYKYPSDIAVPLQKLSTK